eukprot:SAG11_NODE_109_length_16381_cov_48.316546_5_plen_245_part_00
MVELLVEPAAGGALPDWCAPVRPCANMPVHPPVDCFSACVPACVLACLLAPACLKPLLRVPCRAPTAILLSSFILPHALTVGTTTLARQLGECYPIIVFLVLAKFATSFCCWLSSSGSELLGVGSSGYAIMATMVLNRNVTECGCRLANLVVADLGAAAGTTRQAGLACFLSRPLACAVDEDWLLNQRPKPMSSSIAGLYAIASKPGQSLAPMLVRLCCCRRAVASPVGLRPVFFQTGRASLTT